LLRASLREFRELNYQWAVAWSAWGLGTALSAAGRVDEACPLLGEALRIYREVNDPRGVAQCLEALAQIAGERAHYETAARLTGSAAALRARVAAPPPDAEQARTLALERGLARALGPEAADRLVQAGRTNRQIGRALGISEKTAEVHLHHVMAKLEAHSRAEVAAWAVTHHLSAPAG